MSNEQAQTTDTLTDDECDERVTPCRRSPVRERWEVITWPGKLTAYPCGHDHSHCDYIGCVEHIDGMHVDFRGDAIVHVRCHLCRPALAARQAGDRDAHQRIRDLVTLAVNSAYGTDPRHGLLGIAVADAVRDGRDRLPWSLGDHFGRALGDADDQHDGSGT